MSDLPTNDNSNRQSVPARVPATRPPIQWPVRSEVSEQERERAAHIARQRVDRMYSQSGEPNQEAPAHAPQRAEPRPHVDHHTMRNQSYDWQQYHTAWQQYYHQYFYRYYAGWWQQQKQQIESEAQQAPQPIEAAEELSDRQKVANELREKVRTIVEKQSKKVKSSSHFKPILASVFVGSMFLLVNYNQVLVGAVKQYIAPGSVVTTPVIVEPGASNAVSAEPKIIIPKIGVEAPVVYDVTGVDEASYQKGLERGVVRLGTTANPGTKGNVVIGGHSSNNVFNAGKFKYVFVNLKRLDVGDIFYLNYNGQRYTYKITVAKKIITPKETSVLAQTEKPTVTLFTCDPPGTNVNRLIVQAEQIDPSPEAAPANTNQQTTVNKNNPLPSVAPSLWDRLFN
jgi:sortase A